MTERDPSPADRSVVVAVARDLRDLGRWLESSTAARACRRATAALATAIAHSALARLVAVLAAWTRNSFVYRWLTADPEPEVVVVDLRETYTVGPVIALLDRVVPHLERWWAGATFNRALDRTVAAVRRAPVRVVSVVVAAGVLANLFLAVAATGFPSPAGLLTHVALLGVAIAGTRVRASWDALAGARTVQLLAAALEPPEPPDERDSE